MAGARAPFRRVLAPISGEPYARRTERTARRQYPGLRIVASLHAFPPLARTCFVPGAVAAGLAGWGSRLPAYSGGTAWDLHPLRVVAGKSRRVRRRLSVSCAGEYSMRCSFCCVFSKIECLEAPEGDRTGCVSGCSGSGSTRSPTGSTPGCGSVSRTASGSSPARTCWRSAGSPTASASAVTAPARTTTSTSGSRRPTSASPAACSARSRGCGPATPGPTRCRSSRSGTSCAAAPISP